MTVSSTSAAVAVRTRALSGPVKLVDALPDPTGALAFVQLAEPGGDPLPAGSHPPAPGGNGLVGWGEYARLSVSGPGAAHRIGEWFRALTDRLAITDEVGVPGSGPVVFVSLGFGDDDESIAVIPEVVLGRAGGRSFLTTLGGPVALAPAATPDSPGLVGYFDLGLTPEQFAQASAAAVGRIRGGEAAKVVLARSMAARTELPIDERFLLRRLSEAYPSCVSFAVGGLVGASPELLVHRRGDRVRSRVLAGTSWRGHLDRPADLRGSAKDVVEHRLAVESVLDALRPVAEDLDAPADPDLLPLANLTHLATEVTARVREPAETALELAARLHPTAAVGGTPTPAALRMIRELEPVARGRYAAPVGWMDASGDGEFVIALRCAQVHGNEAVLMAGCGIMADSDPHAEAAEAQVKMAPIRDALEGVG